jgi:hypothetical protein
MSRTRSSNETVRASRRLPGGGRWRGRPSGRGYLGRRVGEAVGRVGLAVVALVCFAAGVRLLPLLLDDTVALSTALVFAQILAVPGSQTAALIAVPTGFALAATDLVARGEALALACAGVSPWALLRATLPTLCLALVLPVGATLAWGERAQSPGVLLSSMTDRAAAACGPDRPISRVPWAFLVVLCGGTERTFALVGTRPEAPGTATFLVRAATLELAPDASHAVFRDARIELVGPPLVRLSTPRLVLRGGAPFALPLSVRSGARSLAVFLAIVVASLGSFHVLVTLREPRRSVALWASGAAPALVTLSAIEARGASLPWLVLVPTVAAAPAWLLVVWSRRTSRSQDGFRRRTAPAAGPPASEAPSSHNSRQPPTTHV